jgi:hypothetical protein
MYQRLRGGDDVDVAVALRDLSLALQTTPSVGAAEAERCCRAALAMFRRLYGATTDDANVAASMDCLAHVLEFQSRLADAASLLRDSLSMRRRLAGGGDSNDVVTALRRLANVVFYQGEHDAASGLYHEALSMLQRLHGDGVDHDDITYVLTALSAIASERGDTAGALRLRRQFLAMVLRLHGAGSDDAQVSRLCDLESPESPADVMCMYRAV